MNPFSIQELFGKKTDADQYDAVQISLASPEKIREWSYGEVKNPETINYRSYRPEHEGLFCERIFGPTRDWECACGKYKRVKHKGVVCDRCGVEVTVSKVRRVRMGHIDLAVPVSHVWFLKCAPSRIGTMLDMSSGNLERVLYYEDYLVVDPGDTPLVQNQLLSETDYVEYRKQYGDAFEAQMGAEAVKKVLEKINLDELMDSLIEEMENTGSKQVKAKLSKRMKICEGFIKSNSKPENMILTVMPVIPPELRPLVPLEGGRFATSDLNDLYRRVINRNNRLKGLQQHRTPDVIIRNEKRMLQEAVDAVFDNGRMGKAVVGAGNRPLKSLSDALKGKTGRFRQNLLGKRVDYSGRSVIICGPELKLYQCGLPKKMALVLFEPFIIRRLKQLGEAHTVRSAKKLIERKEDKIWDVLEEVTQGKTVMLNRAPTLHRLSIQSFEPVLVEGEAIKLHPMVCTAFNADFDGDQMAVHVPLSIEAQLESRLLMLSSNSIFSPASGKSIMTPTQDIALGIYYITADSQADRMRILARKKNPETEAERINRQRRLPLFNDANEVHLAFDDGALSTHSRIMFKNPDFGRKTKHGDENARVIETTVGRVFFNEIWPETLGFVNWAVNKSKLGSLIWDCHFLSGHDVTVVMLDKLKDMGFAQATRAGVSIGLVDMRTPSTKQTILDAANKKVDEYHSQYQKGVITGAECHNKVVDEWFNASNAVADDMYKEIEENGWTPNMKNADELEINPIFMMVDSKARGSKQQIRQLAGMRGCMAKPNGEIIELPIRSNFREGLTILEYFISSHGARKGLADTALKTADAGYLTRKLVDVSQDVIITEQDCCTPAGIEVEAIYEGDELKVSLRERILGRTCLEPIYDADFNVLVDEGEEINEAACDKIEAAGVEKVKIRSGLTCTSTHGMCAKCYGRDLATGKPVEIGTAVGIIAAQSIGEPGTQLTMRTFHIGGTAAKDVSKPEFVSTKAGKLKFSAGLKTVENKDKHLVVFSKGATITIVNDNGEELESTKELPVGTIITHKEGDFVKEKTVICTWDSYTTPIMSEFDGKLYFQNFVQGKSIDVLDQIDNDTGTNQRKVIGVSNASAPEVLLVRPAKKRELPAGAEILVDDNETERRIAGSVVAKVKATDKSRYIPGAVAISGGLYGYRNPHSDKKAEVTKLFDSKDINIIVNYDKSLCVEKAEVGGRVLVVNSKNKEVKVEILAKKKNDITDPVLLSSFVAPYGAVFSIKPGERIKYNEVICSWDPEFIPELIDTDCRVKVVDNGDKKVLELSEVITYQMPIGAVIKVKTKDGVKVSKCDVIAKIPNSENKTSDITGGLPRVAELFEARRPKDAAEISRIDGYVTLGSVERGKRVLVVTDPNTVDEETGKYFEDRHLVPMGKHIVVYDGDYVTKGQRLTEGAIDVQEYINVVEFAQFCQYLVNEVQSVYRGQGVEINEKHIEIIVRQMLRKVKITDPGDTDLLWNAQVSQTEFLEANRKIQSEGGRPATATPVLLGITKAALETDSFISAASFQDTTRVLTENATMGSVDHLRGFKENVILGHVIPGGTGFPIHRHLKLIPTCDPIPEELIPRHEEDSKLSRI